MCTVTLDSSRIRKEVTKFNGLLDLIEWTDDGRKDKLRIYSLTAKEWRTIARNLGLEDETPGFINSLARRHRDDNGECVREVFGKWFENAVGLPMQVFTLKPGKVCALYCVKVIVEKLRKRFAKLLMQQIVVYG